MRLVLSGHEYKYAIEQIMLALFPDERPEYGEGSADELTAESRMTFGTTYAQCVTLIRGGGNRFRGVARVKRDGLSDKLITGRLLQKLIKQSFYRAAIGMLDSPPVWGSLTGIRPAKIAQNAIEGGKSPEKILTGEYYVSAERARLCIDSAKASLTVKNMLQPNDIALYVGIPFCPTRCAYCSFVSNDVGKSFGLIDPFVDTLLNEIEFMAGVVSERGLRVIAVYIGGGTPTALPDDALSRILEKLRRSFDLSDVREYTVEAGRPDTITPEKLKICLENGATRISVNPQSMSEDVLAAIGRNHSPQDVLDAVSLVRAAGGMALNMDIIAGLPRDTYDGFENTLEIILNLAPENVTVHTLSLKKGSRIMLEGAAIPDGETVAKMLDLAHGRLRELEYAPYYLYRQKFISGGFENTGWSSRGYEGIYNICMMEELCTVLALGGGGVTKLVLPHGRIERIFNAKYPREYITNLPEKIRRIREEGKVYD